MELIVLGSSSKGNGYLLDPGTGEANSALVIEAGVKLIELKKTIDFDLNRIAGVLVSHRHSDHGGRALEYAKAGLKIITAQEDCSHHNMVPIIGTEDSKEVFKLGKWTIKPFKLVHDVPNYGFLIHHPETGAFPFVTDTHYVPFRFEGMYNIMIEANYSEEIIRSRVASGKVHQFLADRIVFSHTSLETCMDFLKKNDLSKVNNIVLLHLSDGNSSAEGFRDKVQRLTGKMVHIADAGFRINFSKTF